MDIDTILLETEELMEKAINFIKSELRGIRTGRANTSLVEFIKIDYYGSMSDLRSLALISVSDATSIVIKPFDPSSLQAIVKGIQSSGLGLNPVSEGKQIRISVPPLSGDRRNQLISSVKKMGEDGKVSVRNARRDGNKHVDAAEKDKSLSLSEDVVKKAKEEVQDLLKKYEGMIDELVTQKTKEIQDI
ncbi:MAG: ribosome recycling factor [Phycisphaeraceae bacterium]